MQLQGLVRFQQSPSRSDMPSYSLVVKAVVYLSIRSKQDEQERDGLLQPLRNAVNKISELARSLVELSVPLQMERALQNGVGPYSSLHKQVNRSVKNFYHEQSIQFRELEQADTSENPTITRVSNPCRAVD